MLIIDDVTLMEMGRFTFSFNNLDHVITQLAAESIECAESAVAEYLTDGTLGRKLERITEVSKRLAAIYVLDREVLSRQIASANALIEHRNTLLHGLVKIEPGKHPVVNAKKGTLELTPSKLSDLFGQIQPAIDGLISAYFDFMEAVKAARKTAEV